MGCIPGGGASPVKGLSVRPMPGYYSAGYQEDVTLWALRRNKTITFAYEPKWLTPGCPRLTGLSEYSVDTGRPALRCEVAYGIHDNVHAAFAVVRLHIAAGAYPYDHQVWNGLSSREIEVRCRRTAYA